MPAKVSPNFAFLASYDTRLVALATQAEEHFTADPTITLFKLRQFGEVLAQRAAAMVGLYDAGEPQHELINRLFDKRAITVTQRVMFHDLRKVGNAAVHEGRGDHREALHQLRMARELAVWFERSFGKNPKFAPGPFVPPKEPVKPEAALHEEITRLRADVDARSKELEGAKRAIEESLRKAEAEAAARLGAEQREAKAREEAAIWEELANEQAKSPTAAQPLEEHDDKLAKALSEQQAQAAASPASTQPAIERALEASKKIELDERATRRLIDHQLRDAGWEVDSETLSYERGARPVKGKNRAIAEWPTKLDGKEGWADYVLFAGLTAIGVVEAKRQAKDIVAVHDQAKRYSSGFTVERDAALPERSPWGKHRIPFLFTTNGRPYLRQLETKSGIWFLDARLATNHPRALDGWPSPEGLLDQLARDVEGAYAKLKVEPMPYIDREYQRNAIRAVESALEAGQRAALLAMATGTGKTRTCIGLAYRLIKSGRFRRILFLVDRSALGHQTASALKDLRLEALQSFTDIYDVKELGDITPDSDTRLHIATIQAMVKRVLGDDGQPAPTVDQYDCIVVDECHRGYLLDREMSEREFQFRDEEDYISKYRRVLDHFDAVKIGLTATPAVHTTEIFGPPVYAYSYRDAVVDGFLVDHEPPIRIVTELAADGIHFRAREEVLILDRATQEVRKEELPDDVEFEVDQFNRRVITEPFNRAVLAEVLQHIDPDGDEKTLIFCASDEHCDIVLKLLKELLDAKLGSVDDDAIAKITGASDRPLEAIRKYRNERHPNIAITVDLLTTGIDVPRIANLVFLRRVRSRILYEQMLGRATRLCPDIGKERFRIFDAVDLYAKLKDVTDMKPVVVNPFVSFEQLAAEIVAGEGEEARKESLDELIAKLQRKKRSLKGDVAQAVEDAAGMPINDLIEMLKHASVAEAAQWIAKHASTAPVLDAATGGGGYRVLVSHHHDEVREITRGYGEQKRPEDYLETFSRFLKENLNKLPALMVVTQRPRELTRADLRSLRMALDQLGFTETKLRTAWRETRNEDVAATIIGFVRQHALGSPLVAYDERVEAAYRRIIKTHKLTEPQRKWLERIAKQLKAETVVDRSSFNEGAFQDHGGFDRIDKVMGGKLESLLGELVDEVWSDAG